MDTMDIDTPPVESLKREREDGITANASEEPLQKKARVDDDMPALSTYFKVLVVDPDQARAYVLSWWEVEAEDVEGGLAGILRCLDKTIAADYAQEKPFTAMVLCALAAKTLAPFYYGVHRNEEAHAYWADCRSLFDSFKVNMDSYADGDFKLSHLFGMSAHREIRSSFTPYPDPVNFLKARMTNFSTITKYFKNEDNALTSMPESDEMTGITKYREGAAMNYCRDPHLDGPGKSKSFMLGNMQKRMIEDVHRRLQIDNVDNEQTEGAEAQTELTRAQHRELFIDYAIDEKRRRAIHTFAQLNKEEEDNDEMPDLVPTLQDGLPEEKLND